MRFAVRCGSLRQFCCVAYRRHVFSASNDRQCRTGGVSAKISTYAHAYSAAQIAYLFPAYHTVGKFCLSLHLMPSVL